MLERQAAPSPSSLLVKMAGMFRSRVQWASVTVLFSPKLHIQKGRREKLSAAQANIFVGRERSSLPTTFHPKP
jgi:hypothetical protein